MKILGWDIKLARGSSQAKTVQAPKSPIYQFPIMTQQQGFSAYNNVQGQQQLTYELIDGLYKKTIMNRVINKISGDCTRMNYTVSYINLDNTKNEQIEEIGNFVDVKLTRTVFRNIFRDMLKYGTAFLYVQYDAGRIPIKMYTIHPRYVKPEIENGVLVRWIYNSGDGEKPLAPEDLICFPNDPATGEIFGNSIFGPIIQILELLLNSQYNTAILIDRYAIPIIHWMLDNGVEGVRTPPEEITNFLESLFSQLDVGNDIATDSGVQSKVIGTDSNLIDFVPIIQDQKETFGITVGVPLQLIGMKGDNLSVTTRQMQSYIDFLRDIQEMVADRLIEFLYKPYLLENGYVELDDYKRIDIDFPVMAVEENSKAIQWLVPAVDKGFITRTQAKNTLGFKGEAVPIDEIELFPSPEVIRPSQRKDPSEVKDPDTKQPDRTTNPDHE